MEKKSYPLIVSKEIQRLLRIVRNSVLENSVVLEIIETKDIIFVRDRDKNEFRFKIFNPTQNREFTPIFNYEYLPENDINLESSVHIDSVDKILLKFNKWISLIKEYNEINFTEEDHILHFYEDEYFQEFEILDEEADVNPFAENQQKFLYNFLSLMATELERLGDEGEQVGVIITETNYLKDNIQNLTKTQAIIKMSKVFARLKKYSLKIALDILDVIKKEAIKKALYGADDIGHLLQGLF